MPLTFFTVRAEFRSVTADTDTDTDYDPQVGLHLTGTVTFTPLVEKGDVLVVGGIAYIPAPITGRIHTDGLLVLRPTPDPGGGGSYAPIKLLADSPDLNLSAPLAYQCDFSDVRLDGKTWQIRSLVFNAPAGGELNLVDVMPAAGQLARQAATVDWSQITNKPAHL